MSEIRIVKSPEDFQEILELSKQAPVMLLKHSTRCPISSFADAAFSTYADGAETRGVTCVMVLVVEDRTVSLLLAEELGVMHQSPQAILIRGGKAVWNDSHEGVSVEALTDAESFETRD